MISTKFLNETTRLPNTRLWGPVLRKHISTDGVCVVRLQVNLVFCLLLSRFSKLPTLTIYDFHNFFKFIDLEGEPHK